MTSTAQHTQVVQKQFGEQAAAYLSSAVHAQGSEFALLQAELAGQGEARVLDLGCGAGHVSFHVAPLVRKWWLTTCRSKCLMWLPALPSIAA